MRRLCLALALILSGCFTFWPPQHALHASHALACARFDCGGQPGLRPIPHHPYHAACAARRARMHCDALVVDGIRPHIPAGYGPDVWHTAYALPTAPVNGSPQTVAIVDAYDDPTITSDLAAYDAQYGLPPASLTVVDERGTAQRPPPDPENGWPLETALDVETVHGVCPTCRILLVLAASPTMLDLGTAENTAARLGATEISNSWGGNEDSTERASDTQYFSHPGVAITVSSGDWGYGVEYPAASPAVLAVGGTTLAVTPAGSYGGETAWNGSGSGCSAYELTNIWQRETTGWPATGCQMQRGVADVAADADPNTGAAVYSEGSWYEVGGTSLAAPLIAATIALAGGESGVQNAQRVPYAHPDGFHDITAGSNGHCATTACQAAPGYDGPTGLGTPDGVSGFEIGSTPIPPTETPPSPTATGLPPTPTPSPTFLPPPPPPIPTATPKPLGHCDRWGTSFTETWAQINGQTKRIRYQVCAHWVSAR